MTRQVALVTGARQGLGQGAAVSLARRGFDLVLVDVVDDLSETVALVEAEGAAASVLTADLADVAGHAALVDAAWDAFGRVDCLVNNAGLAMRPLTDLLDITSEAYDRVVDVNQRGTFFLTQAVAKRMIAAGGDGGHRSIITVSSIAARMVSTLRSPYNLSKTALSMMTELFAVRLAEEGIAAYEVRPGYMRTAMTASAVPEELTRSIEAGRVPARRWGTPDDVGQTIATLAAGELPFSTGQAIWVDGGLHMHQAD